MQRKTIWLTSLSIFLIQVLISQQKGYFKKQSPYEITFKKDISLGLGAAGLYFLGTRTLDNEAAPEYTIGDFTQTDIDNINFIDRGAAKNWNLNAKSTGKSFVFTASTAIPIGLLAFPGDLKSRASLALIFYEGYFLTGGLVTLTKGATNRYRPFTYLSQSEIDLLDDESRTEFLEDIEGNDIEDSFFSGDAAKTAYGFIFFAKAFNDYFPESKLRKVIWATSFAAVGLQGYFRVKSGKHFPTDVIVGSLVGGGLGYLIPHLHKKLNNKESKLTFGCSGNGFSLALNF